ncbi:RNA methyltransferase [Limibacter armeniacum]|uniref:TrmH family RNA methyltransferase n=1 Tax=Limibacter armeniacum TaxID=466084 RepID=UPI002FE53523
MTGIADNKDLINRIAEDESAYQYLRSFVTPNKQQLFEKVLAHRTRHVTVVLEDIYQPQNASAVIRSCDCFGIQDLHIIEVEHTYELNKKVVKGASKWVDRHHYSSNEDAIKQLKNNGYKIVATTPHTDMTLDELPLDDKVALMFGTESTGLTDYALSEADYKIRIPMYGFSESFNISVSAAVSLNHLMTKLHNSQDIKWQLSPEEYKRQEIRWILKVINKVETHVKDFYKKQRSKYE